MTDSSSESSHDTNRSLIIRLPSTYNHEESDRTSLTTPVDHVSKMKYQEKTQEHTMHILSIKSPRIDFQCSPFYSTLVETIGSTRMVSPHGGTLKMDFILNTKEIQLFQGHRETFIEYGGKQFEHLSGKSSYVALVLMCGIINMNSQENSQPIPVEFPKYFNVRINFVAIPSTLIAQHQKTSQKEWYALPMDLTKFVKLKPNFRNTVDIAVGYHSQLPSSRVMYSHAKFVFAMRLVEKLTVDYLIQNLPKESNQEMNSSVDSMLSIERTFDHELNQFSGLSEIQESDLVSSWSKTGLRDPLSRQLIRLPCRSTTCRHLECFDAEIYLKTNENHPRWQCPICHQRACLEDLRISSYFEAILVMKDQKHWKDDVTIYIDHKTGYWKPCFDTKETSFFPSFSMNQFQECSNEKKEPNHDDDDDSTKESFIKRSHLKRSIIDLTIDDAPSELEHEDSIKVRKEHASLEDSMELKNLNEISSLAASSIEQHHIEIPVKLEIELEKHLNQQDDQHPLIHDEIIVPTLGFSSQDPIVLN